ncbi:MAG TPA: DedA family protein [Chloroflexota bacterium]|jgi:membrane protein DedA with SNARE-associated domain
MNFSVNTLHQLLSTWGYLAVFLFVAVESTGIPFPGETMLITAAAYAGAGHLQIPFVIAAAAMGAIMGDNAGYLVGRTGGREIALRYGRVFRIDEAKLGVAERFFDKYGDKTVFFGRFVAVLRAWAAFLAGVNRMPWRKFFVFNAAGGITWSILYGVLAFELGKNLSLLDKIVKTVGYVGLGGAVVAAVVLFVLYRRRRSKAGTSPPSSSDALESASPVANDSVSAGERADRGEAATPPR